MDIKSNALSRINSFYKRLSPSEKKVADYILTHAKEVIHMPMSEVAKNSDVSDPSVLRFCRSLGYTGYLDYKLALTQDLASPTEFISEAVKEHDGVSEITQKTFAAANKGLYDSLQGLDMLELARAVDLIKNARLVLIIGVGTSAPIAQIFYNRLIRIGINTRVQTDSYLQLMEASLLNEDDVVMSISQTGASIDPIITLEEARSHGAKTIALTGSLASPITKNVDVCLFSATNSLQPEDVSSRISQIIILESIFLTLSMQNLEHSNNNEHKLWSAIVKKTL